MLADRIREPNLKPLDEWAEGNIVFPDSPISKSFKVENMPQLIEPLRAWHDPMIRAVSVLAGVQGCKTGLGQIVIADAVARNPGNVLVTAQTDDEAKFYAKTKLLPCLRESAETKNIVAGLGRDDVTQEHILLGKMFVQIQGPSLSGSQSKTIKTLINEEMWTWEKGTIEHLLRRTNAVRNRKILSGSQGGEQIETETGQEDWDEWGAWWHQGTQEWFEVRCPGCEQFFGPETRVYPKGKYIVMWDDIPETRNQKTKEWNWKAMRQTVRMQCPHCDRRIENRERDRRALIQDWRYQAYNQNPSPNHRSFRYSGYSLWWRDLAEMVEMYLRAQDSLHRGDIEPLKNYTQKEEARFWTLADKAIPVINKKEASGYRIETYETKEGEPLKLIDDEKQRFCAIDFQRDRFPMVIRAFSNFGSKKLFCDEPQTIEDVIEVVKQYGLKSGAVGFDVGNWSKDAMRFCFLNRWTPLRGRDVRNFTKTRGRRKPVQTRHQAVMERLTGDRIYPANTQLKVLEWSNMFYKDILSRIRMMPEHQIPDDVPQLYVDSMESEAKDKKTGIWKQIGARPNHYWDCEAMITFMASLYGFVGTLEKEDEGDESNAD